MIIWLYVSLLTVTGLFLIKTGEENGYRIVELAGGFLVLVGGFTLAMSILFIPDILMGP